MAPRAVLSVLVVLLLIGCRQDGRRGPDASVRHDTRSSVTDKPPAGRPATALFVEYVTTPQDVVERMLEIAKVTKNDVVYDLGCGDGRIVITAAQRYGCRAVGYDVDPLRIREARENVARRRVAHLVTIEQQDVLQTDLREASVVTLYLGTEINARLIPPLRQLRSGARIVSHDFPIGNLRPDRVVKMTSRTDRRQHTLYRWTCPLPPESR